ncbi:MAG: hypothetical protein G01um101466_15 [Parcubacteria group bacterium Gr01-1014_66]|nr:MAG: hypothetical protein G01um101466_15 [Parcubacteria group bacterium Gr01-1014_66]
MALPNFEISFASFLRAISSDPDLAWIKISISWTCEILRRHGACSGEIQFLNLSFGLHNKQTKKCHLYDDPRQIGANNSYACCSECGVRIFLTTKIVNMGKIFAEKEMRLRGANAVEQEEVYKRS